jgi:hypothetical protein
MGFKTIHCSNLGLVYFSLITCVVFVCVPEFTIPEFGVRYLPTYLPRPERIQKESKKIPHNT